MCIRDRLVRRPHETILVLISDLFEGGNREEMLKRAAALIGAGVQMIVPVSYTHLA